jgi:DNA-binding CsgD family transcriptional regulator
MSAVAETLRGREAETAALAALVARARDGRSGALVLCGEPGIGKSALLEAAVSLAEGFLVIRARGIESESEIAFSGLQELLRPVVSLLDRLPERQRAVLAGALALGPPVPGDPLAIRAATLGILAAAAERARVVVVVDDAHWLDPPSAEALAFAARRLDREGIAALFAVREAEPSAFNPTGLSELIVRGLGRGPARELLAARAGGAIAPEVVGELLAVAAGNPLALLELPAALTPAQLSGREPLQEPLPVGAGVERAFASRLAQLPTETREALLIAAASGHDEQAAVAAALNERGVNATALELAEHAGLIEISEGRLSFRHPLVRSVVYQSASGEQRRAAHSALANSTDEAAERRAWHQAAAAAAQDERIAAALEEAASRAAARGGLPTAARTYQRAARLSVRTQARARRLLAAATCAHASGRLEWAAELLQEGLPLAETVPTRADFHQLTATVERDRGSVIRSREMLWEAAAAIASEHPSRATLMLIDATCADTMSGDLVAAAESGRRARDLALTSAVSPAIQLVAAVTHDWVASWRGELPSDEVAIESARMTVNSAPDIPRAAAIAVEMLWAAWYAQQVESADPRHGNDLDRAIAGAREHGEISMLPYLLGHGAQLDAREDRWSRAAARAGEAAELASGIGQVSQRAWGLLNLARIEAAQGHEIDCRAHVMEADNLAQASGAGALQVYVSSVLGLLELGLGNIPRALEQLERCARQVEACGNVHPNVVPYEPDLVEALHTGGRDDDAHAAADLLTIRSERVRSNWGRATAARCHALLTDEHNNDEQFEAALALHDRLPSKFERARTQLCYGERLRRGRRKRDAREQLTQALTTFERLGAAPWAERTRHELAATGLKARTRSSPTATEQLTPQELRVALIIADGATIREAAVQLFLSPKTIEAHLSRAYRKLGVHNRAQLATTLTHHETTSTSRLAAIDA